jgi:hypothetical protein
MLETALSSVNRKRRGPLMVEGCTVTPVFVLRDSTAVTTGVSTSVLLLFASKLTAD